MDEFNNENKINSIQAEVSVNHQQIEKETVVIKEKGNKSLIAILVFVLLIAIGIGYLVYTIIMKPSYDYTIQDMNGESVIFNQLTGAAYYPETRIKISIDDYVKKREGQIFNSSSIIPASPDLYVSARVKASENSILYSIQFDLSKFSASLSEAEMDQKINKLRDVSNNNAVYLNFYDKDNFHLFSHKVSVTGGTRNVNSNGYGTGLTLEGIFSEDLVLIGLISSFEISWTPIKM